MSLTSDLYRLLISGTGLVRFGTSGKYEEGPVVEYDVILSASYDITIVHGTD